MDDPSHLVLIVLGSNDMSILVGHFESSPREEIEEIVEGMKERDRKERGRGMKYELNYT